MKNGDQTRLFPDFFPKTQNWVYISIHSLKFYTAYFDFMPSWGLSKYIETIFEEKCFSCYILLPGEIDAFTRESICVL